ncbi:S1C family serine protease [Sporosarcina aquimarina]|uniref:S1C family serine protease n=1 Tax=Sporosarcina aquimarina TaxID=114975 RepID=A0ABU4G2M7_9BACL|nr:S1C family serine protease [Sporosarcina aquimarina]MDW0111225.1 S1C family serine protease [Sporosarcina aquimarina]
MDDYNHERNEDQQRSSDPQQEPRTVNNYETETAPSEPMYRTQSTPPPPPPELPKRRGGFLPALFGAVLGGLLVWLLMYTVGGSDANKTAGTVKESGSSEQVSVDIDSDLTGVVEKSTDAVVGITNLQRGQDFWSQSETPQAIGTGSGVLYKKENGKAYIVTNHHVVEDAEELEVTLDDGTKIQGKLIGSDVWTDLAVVEIDDKDITSTMEFGDSDALKRGETVIAIGNPLGLGFSGSVTVGVVSGKDRSIPIDINKDGSIDWQADVLQTDAAINPGNSGGALINMAGQLIGINSMKITEETVEGIGLAIPINLALPVIEQLEETGEVNRPTMGVSLLDLRNIPVQQQSVLKLPEDVKNGVVVTEVFRNTPAQTAGVEKYDTIVEMDGKPIEDMVTLRKHLYNEKKVGDSMTMKVYRDGKAVTIDMVLKDGNSF